MELEIRKLAFWDTKGFYRVVEGCPITRLKNLRILYPKLLEIIGNRDFITASNETRVMNLSYQILDLFGIDPEWIDLPTLAALLHSYEDANGNPHPGKIQELYFNSATQEGDSTPVSWEEYYNSILANLILTEGSINSALEVAEKLPAEELENLLVKHTQNLKQINEVKTGVKAPPTKADIEKARKEYTEKMKRIRSQNGNG